MAVDPRLRDVTAGAVKGSIGKNYQAQNLSSNMSDCMNGGMLE